MIGVINFFGILIELFRRGRLKSRNCCVLVLVSVVSVVWILFMFCGIFGSEFVFRLDRKLLLLI